MSANQAISPRPSARSREASFPVRVRTTMPRARMRMPPRRKRAPRSPKPRTIGRNARKVNSAKEGLGPRWRLCATRSCLCRNEPSAEVAAARSSGETYG